MVAASDSVALFTGNEENDFRYLPSGILGYGLGSIGLGLFWQELLEYMGYPALVSIIPVICLMPLSLSFWLSYLVKIIKNPLEFMTDLSELPSHASIAAGIMTLANYAAVVYSLNQLLSNILWNLSAFLFVIHFGVYFWFRFQKREPFNSIFYPYIFVSLIGLGIYAAASKHQNLDIATASLMIGFPLLFIIMPIVIYRLSRFSKLPFPVTPTVTIIMAPTNLLLSGKLATYPHEQETATYMLYMFSLCLDCYGYLNVWRFLRKDILPTHSAMTFPLTITGVSALRMLKVTGFSYLRYWLPIVVVVGASVNSYLLFHAARKLVAGTWLRKTVDASEREIQLELPEMEM
mmetsp:Transcript_51785/g.59141  ORF Transcript_51785/g.59141 Transcript_51785/m.59141 type:complete len:348 (+) Transcript_51785:38-1081(+)